MTATRCNYAPNYTVTSTERTTEDGIPYTAYGIVCTCNDILTGNKYVRTVEDVSSDPELVDGMVNLFNLCCLSADCLPQTIVNLIA